MIGIDAALGWGAPDRSGGVPFYGVVIYMKQETQSQNEDPVGIVISRGWEPATTPRFTAYMWAPGPEDEVEQEVVAV